MVTNIDTIPSVARMRLKAKSRLPKAVFDFIDGGADDELTLRHNVDDFAAYAFQPKVLRDVAQVSLERKIFEQVSAMPVIIAPTGLAGLAWPRAERLLAQAARAKNIPFTLAALGSCDIEEIATINPLRRWFQLYVLKDRDVTKDLLSRAQQSGYEVLVITVDVPVVGKRERDVVNGFTVPLRWSPRMFWDMVSHPQWSLETLRAGVPTMKSVSRYAGIDTDAVAAHATWVNNAFDPSATWDDVAAIRDIWAGKLLIKGVMSCDDAERALQIGADGIVVSNHGGRQLDGALSSVHALARIATHIDGRLPLFLDSGVRRGSDIVKALCLGATAVLVGRATLYGAAAGGEPGIARVLHILHEEIARTLALIGVDDINALDKTFLHSTASDTT